MNETPQRELSDQARPGPSEFLERSVYRRRRLLDAVKLLPILGLLVFLVPALILGESAGSTATRLIYFFFCWAGLIACCALLVRALTTGKES